MDSAVWVMQGVIDHHRQEREADAAAHRRFRGGVRRDEAQGRRTAPFRWQRRADPIAAVAAAAAQERAGDELELTGAGQPQ